MAIDPALILGYRPTQVAIPSQTDTLQKSLVLSNRLDQGEMNRLGLDERRREVDTNDRIRALLGQNPNATPEEVMAIDPKRGMEIGKFRAEEAAKKAAIGKDTAAARKSDFERQMMQLQHGATLLNTVKDGPSFEQAIKIGVSNGVFPEEQAAQWLQQGYNPQFVEQLKAGGLKYAEKLKADHDAAVLAQTKLRDQQNNQVAQGNLQVARGNLANSTARLDFERTGGRAPAGYRFNNMGNLEFIPGGPADPSVKKPGDDDAKTKTLNMYVAARDGLLTGLEGATTGPALGRIPAFTSGQQIAEGGVSAMAPVLKQLFRVAGEGTFTDKDQELLLGMVPTRADKPAARAAKMANIDRIVSAKLGMPVPARPTPTAPGAAGEAPGVKFLGFEESP